MYFWFKSLIKGFFIWVSIQVNVTITIEPQNTKKEITIKQNAQVLDVIRKLELKPDGVIVLRGQTPIPVDTILDSAEKLTIIQVASGG